MKKLFPLLTAAILIGSSVKAVHAENLLYDGNFQQAGSHIPAGRDQTIINASLIQSGSAPIVGWQTTATDNKIELWQSGFLGFTAPIGSDYFAELNAYQVSSLFQVEQLTEASPVSFSLAHRGRRGTDVMDLKVYDIGSNTSWSLVNTGTLVFNQRMTDGNTQWGYYSNDNMFTPTAGDYYAFTFESVSAAGGDLSVGNLLGNAQFGYGVGAIPEPSTYALFGLGTLALIVASRRRNKSATGRN